MKILHVMCGYYFSYLRITETANKRSCKLETVAMIPDTSVINY